MNYFVMAYPARVDSFMAPGNANPIYTSIFPDDATNNYAASGYFVWTKSPVGYPWDIKTFDTQYVYDRTTELSWTDPTTFKRFDHDLPMTRRCPLSFLDIINIIESMVSNNFLFACWFTRQDCS